jgi:hypothetical protein
MSFLGRALARMETKGDASAAIFAALFGERSSKSGVAVSVDTALRVSTVIACTRVIAEGIAQVPLKLYKERKDGGKELATDHPLYVKLWRRPNDWQTSFEWRETTAFHAVLAKGGFGYVNRGTNGKVLEILPIAPGAVCVRQTADREIVYDVSTAERKDGVRSAQRDDAPAGPELEHLLGPRDGQPGARGDRPRDRHRGEPVPIPRERHEAFRHPLDGEVARPEADKDAIKKNVRRGLRRPRRTTTRPSSSTTASSSTR